MLLVVKLEVGSLDVHVASLLADAHDEFRNVHIHVVQVVWLSLLYPCATSFAAAQLELSFLMFVSRSMCYAAIACAKGRVIYAATNGTWESTLVCAA